jgi:ferritin-like metal-binding protein YciE
MSSSAEQKIVQYLNEAHAAEVALVSVLRSQISMTGASSYREALETHLDETRDHADRIQARLSELGDTASPLQAAVGFTETMIGQVLALAKAPFDLMRGSGEEEKALKNAKDACATEALEIATYTALEQLAGRAGDTQTAKLAATIRADEERMIKRIMNEIPGLTDAVVGTDIGDAVPSKRTRSRTPSRPRQTKPTPRKAGTRAASESASSEPRPRGASRRRHEEPWSGYDELTTQEIEAVILEGDEELARKVYVYEREHAARPDVMQRALIPVPQIIKS